MEIRNQQSAVDALAHFIGDTISFISHNDQATWRELFFVDVLTIQEGAIDGIGIWQTVEQICQWGVDDIDASQTAHRGLYNLGVPGIGSILATDKCADAKPVGDADDGSQIAWVLNTIERKRQCMVAQ